MGSCTTSASSRRRLCTGCSRPRRNLSGSAPATTSQRARGCSSSSCAICSGSAVSAKRGGSSSRSSSAAAWKASSTSGRRTRSTASLVCNTTSSMSRSSTAPVDMTRPSATSGEEAARRSIAPSISTCSAPWASIASLTARTSAAALGPAISIARPPVPGPVEDGASPAAPGGLELTRAISTRPRGVRTPGSSSSSCGTPLARSSASVVATRLPATRRTRGFSMRASITSRSSPSRPTEVTPTGRPAS